MIHDPKILILDEPVTLLDQNQIVEIRELIKNLGKAGSLKYGPSTYSSMIELNLKLV